MVFFEYYDFRLTESWEFDGKLRNNICDDVDRIKVCGECKFYVRGLIKDTNIDYKYDEKCNMLFEYDNARQLLKIIKETEV